MNSAVQAVTHHHADMGIIFDTDVDRAASLMKRDIQSIAMGLLLLWHI